MQDPLAELNAEQRQAVLATDGPVLVLAGAGSGKTRALTHRIAYLLQQRKATPEELFAVTFTNKAAAEMKERISLLLGSAFPLPAAIGTFHSLGARMLRDQSRYLPRSRHFLILDERDSERCVAQAMERLNLSKKEWGVPAMRHAISEAKNKQIEASTLLQQADSERELVLARIYQQYEAILQANDAYDFDDLIIEPIRLLEHNTQVRSAYQQRWRWLSVDEYQDTSPPQDRLLHLLLGPEKNLCVVGDDYQAIYSWRGARVDHILDFQKRFPDCATVYLTQNYRSTPPILEAANQLIAENVQQMHKELWTAQTEGTPVELITVPSDRTEARLARQMIQTHQENGGALRDWLILYRTNAQSRVLEEEFLMAGLPYTIVGGYRFYERREIKDALAFLQLLINPHSSLSLQRLAGSLLRGVGPKTITRWEELARSNSTSLLDILQAEAQRKRLLQPLARTFQQYPTHTFGTVADSLRWLLKQSGYIAYLETEPDGVERLENIEELFNVTAGYTSAHVFMEEVALLTSLDTAHDASDRITCMTLHASKGLEYPRVIIVGCEEGLLPHSNSMDSAANLEEERRLLYVGMTRAKQQLVLTQAASRVVHGKSSLQTPSRFLRALPASVLRTNPAEEQSVDAFLIPASQAPHDNEPLVEVAAEGDFVSHKVFGRGVVIEVTGSLLTCVFPGCGVKTISAESLHIPFA